MNYEDLLAFEELLFAAQADLGESLARSILKSWLTGAQRGASFAPATPEFGAPFFGPPSFPPSLLVSEFGDQYEIDFPGLRKAVDLLAKKELLSPEDYYSVAEAARSQAFTISGDLTQKTIGKVRDLLTENVEGPANYATFVEEASAGLPISDAHLEQVYRNAANQAYSQGLNDVLDNPLVATGFPYRAYYAVHDARARHDHQQLEKMGLDGTNVFYFRDPTWLRFQPPWSWNCRCGWAPLSIKDAMRLGVQEAKEWYESGFEPSHTFVTPPPFAPDPRWERLPI